MAALFIAVLTKSGPRACQARIASAGEIAGVGMGEPTFCAVAE